MHKILVVDDELSIRESFSLILESQYKVQTAATGEAALKAVTGQKFDLAFLDVRMPGLDGLETLKRLKQIDSDLEVIMVTAVNDMRKASEAVKLGARDYIIKPFDVNQILKLTEKILIRKGLLHESLSIQNSLHLSSNDLIGQSEKYTAFMQAVNNLKDTSPLLIMGENGTEKEALIEYLIQKSHRSSLPYKKLVIFSALSPLKVKALLFGREKGANTIELQGESGILEQAKGGTVYLENFDALSEESFKIIASGQFTRLGGTEPTPIESLIIASTFSTFLQNNRAAADYFGQNIITIPPLRERLSDIPLLINNLIERFGAIYKSERTFSPTAMEVLTNYNWPGNMAELENIIERAYLYSSAPQIDIENLSIDLLLHSPASFGSNLVANFEKEYISNIFKKYNGDKDKSAAILGVTTAFLEARI
ncbi:MAG: sigma-54 dependent transcriptional regulator [Candidatus Margulisiibacteriota bacterium]